VLRFTLRQLSLTESFDPTTLVPDVPFTQAQFYGEWQQALGREVRRYVVEQAGRVVAYCQLIKFPLVRDKSYWYAPYGPVVSEYSPELVTFLRAEFNKLARATGAVFVRFDFTPPVVNSVLNKFFTLAPSYTYHSAYFQPRAEWRIALGSSEQELLAGMHKNTRYSLRVGEKRGVIAQIITHNFSDYFSDFYRLMSATAARNKFSLHPRQYYQHIFAQLKSDHAYLVLAKLGQEVLAIDVVIYYGSSAYYVYAASSNEHRDAMPSYVAVWTAIQEAKRRELAYFNFGGISVDGLYHGWEGLTKFKQRFGGAVLTHSNFVDIVTQPLWYHMYNIRKYFKSYFS
jgi:lipid II:glycine glycyltransferase (peptidoglycan interpeptide bridge formation enzyme)